MPQIVDEDEDSRYQSLDLMIFVYPEVPIANHGYSPFELLFGQCVEEGYSVSDLTCKLLKSICNLCMQSRIRYKVHQEVIISADNDSEIHYNTNKIH